MTKQEARRLARQYEVLESLGFTYDEADKLRRISMTLHRWHELECGDDFGCVERDEHTGKPFMRSSRTDRTYPIADRETGAKKRLAKLIEGKPVSAYIQTDPRGAALYLLRPGDVPEGADVSAYYSRGICVY